MIQYSIAGEPEEMEWMSVENNSERVMVFVDLENVLKISDRFIELGYKIDLRDMVRTVVGERKLVEVYFFDCIESEGDPRIALHDALRRYGYKVNARIGHDRYEGKQKEVDVAMGCEIVFQACVNSYDTAIIVSGDRDFFPALERVHAVCKRVEVASFFEALSRKLSACCDTVHFLNTVPIFYRIHAPVTVEYSESLVTEEEITMIGGALTMLEEAMA